MSCSGVGGGCDQKVDSDKTMTSFRSSQQEKKRKKGEGGLLSRHLRCFEIRLVLLREEVLHVALDALLGQVAHGVGGLGSQVPCK